MADLGQTLGKQVGPLPLGAWVVVVGAGLGIAYYTTRSRNAPVVVEDGSGVPGVGVGGSGMYTQLTPVVDAPGNAKPTTNEEWGVKAINWLIAMNYPSNSADSAVRKYLAGAKLSAQEYTLIGLVLVALGAPPQVLPPSEDGDTTPPVVPPVTTPPATSTGSTIPTHVKVLKGWFLDEWIRDINLTYPGLNLSWEKYYAFNILYPTNAHYVNGVGHRSFAYDGYVRIR